MTAPARIAAYQALRAIADERADLPSALAHSRERLSDERDRALAAEIVTGSLRWQRSLDHLVSHFANRPLEKVDRDVLHIFRLSLYQLLHLDRVPASAVVDDAVDLTRHARKGSASGFVNAVLRSALRQRNRLPLPAAARTPKETARRRSRIWASPTRIPTGWSRAGSTGSGSTRPSGGSASTTRRRALTLRANTLRASRERCGGLARGRRHRDTSQTLRPGRPDRRRRQSAAACPRTDRSSSRTKPRNWWRWRRARDPGERVLDLCASPGGKTVAMAADMGDRGIVVACDVRREAHEPAARDRAHQRRRSHPRSPGSRSPARCRSQPCSIACSSTRPARASARSGATPTSAGAGTSAIWHAWRRTSSHLLERAAAVVRPGGRLVYATCSSEPEENERSSTRSSRATRTSRWSTCARRRDAAAAAPRRRGMLRTLPSRTASRRFSQPSVADDCA